MLSYVNTKDRQQPLESNNAQWSHLVVAIVESRTLQTNLTTLYSIWTQQGSITI